MKFRWSVAPPQAALAAQLASELRIPPLFAQCLLNRGFSDRSRIDSFLDPKLKGLADPFLLPQMGAAVERLFKARERQEKVVIFGDYDVDGVTATALLLQVLRPLSWQVDYYLPHRLDEGYGLTLQAVANCLGKHPAALLVAVDCGSTAIEPVAQLREQGIDVIVVDHHQVASPAPKATALVNPRSSLNSPALDDYIANEGAGTGIQWLPTGALANCFAHSADGNGNGDRDRPPPFAELCSAGLAFKLAHALVKRGRAEGLPAAVEFDLRPLLDLVALGTIADLVPLTGENRILVSAGLSRLNSTTRPGLLALKQVAGCRSFVGPVEVGFQLGPRLNAAGRLQTAEEALRLLLCSEPSEALTLAQSLDICNRERQALERTIVEEALEAVRARFNPESDYVIVEGNPSWHVGVVGIVASRLLQQFYRPTIVVGGDGENYRGSGRSVAGFDLAAALRECGDLLLRHGGHAMAAGVSIERQNLDAFRSRLNDVARKRLSAEALLPPLQLDAEAKLHELDLECLKHLERLAPTGQGNPAAQFCAGKLECIQPPRRMGAEHQHVKLRVSDGTALQEVVWWDAADAPLPAGMFDLAFVPKVNQFNGQRMVQLKLLDWRNTTT